MKNTRENAENRIPDYVDDKSTIAQWMVDYANEAIQPYRDQVEFLLTQLIAKDDNK